MQVTGHNSSWVSPFGHPRINARLPTPQGISQAPTSFIGSRCQGIHHAPLPTCHTNHQHTQQTRVPETLCVQNDQDTKRYTTLQTITHKQTPTPPHNRAGQGRSSVRDARVHYPIIKQQETNQPLRPPTPARSYPTESYRAPASDASDTQQRIMQSTRPLAPKREQGCRLCSTSEHPISRPARSADRLGCAP